MLARYSSICSSEHYPHTGQFVTSCKNDVWQFGELPRPSPMEQVDSRNWARQWCRPTHLGSSNHATLCSHVHGGTSSTIHMHTVKKAKSTSRASLCGWHGLVNNESQVADNVSSKMQKLLTIWNSLLKVMGGKLVLEKCLWYLIDFKWANKQWK